MAVQDKTGNFGTRVAMVAAGVLAIIAINWTITTALSRSITRSLLEHEGQVKQEFLNGVLAADASGGELFQSPGPSPALLAFSAHVRSLPGTVRANIYSPDGFFRQSTDANLIGLHFNNNDELAESFTGKISSALESGSGQDKAEHLALNQVEGEELIEAYIPVLDRNGKVAAVVEFYRRDAWVSEMVASITRSMWIAAGLSSAILAMLLWFATGRSTAKAG